MQTDVQRTEQINLKLLADEMANLEKLASHYAISPQSVLRMLLKKEADRTLSPGITYRRILAFLLERRTVTPDDVASQFQVSPELGRNVLRPFIDAEILEEIAPQTSRLVRRPGERSFRVLVRSMAKAISALEARSFDLERVIQS
jgi:hypothetical protein